MNTRRTFIGFTLTLGLLGSLGLWRQANLSTAQAATGSAHAKLATKAGAVGLPAPLFATITVNTTADDNTVNGNCTLREALLAANTNAAVDACTAGAAGLDNIVFNLGAGTPSIAVTGSALPTITEPVTLSGNTGGATRVELNGAGAGGSANGLRITAGNSTIEGMVINRFGQSGILLQTNGGNLVRNCYVGTNASGTAVQGNLYGVQIDSAPNNTIGGTTASERNLISGNGSVGMWVLGAAATGNKISGNYIGTDVNGTAALGNRFGVQIRSSNTMLGGTTVGERNVISGNTNVGVYLVSAPTPASGIKVSGNYIGTDVTGTVALGNAVGGIRIEAAANNTIGGTTAGESNVISGNSGYGVFVTGTAASGNKVSGNYIGVNVTGNAAIPNTNSGIYLGTSVNNLLIGTNADGVNDLAERNLISGNLNDGITGGFTDSATPFNVTVAGNYIGTDVSGTFAIPNGDSAAFMTGSGHRIGTNSDGINDVAEGNLLSGNRQSGVTLKLSGSPAINTNNLVAGNYIGTQADGVSPLGNGYAGVRLLGAGTNSNTIGGTLPAARNVIAFNGNSADVTPKAGILDLTGGPGNAFLGNAIFSNTGLGIDLGTAGLTANDPDDTDTGPNQLQNYPVLTDVSAAGVISGSLNSTVAAAAYPVRLEFFANSTCDPSDHGEGEVFLGAITVNGPGNFTTPAFALPAGKQIVTATATDTNGNTSEFSACCALITLGPASLANGVQGTAYNQAVVASPAGGNYTYAVTTNILPPGLSLNPATGVISGTPSAPGNYAFVITATGWGGMCTGTRSYQILITGTCAAITLDQTVLPGGAVGTSYNQTISATGGTSPYTFAVTQGALPTGLSLSSSGALTGTPTAAGTFSFRITATSQGSCTGSRNYLLTVGCTTLTVSPATLPNAVRGQSYSQTLSITPAGTYTFSLLLGQLPPGYTLNSAGVINGITNQTGTFNFTLKVIGGSCQATKAYTLIVNSGNAALAQTADYDGDGRSDFAVWSGQGTWRLSLSSDGANRQTQTARWGGAGDVTLLGDYDGDGQTDLAVFRPSEGTFYIKRSSDGATLVKAWGLATDVPVPGDYDGDGKTDIAVWRGAEGHWYIVRSSDDAVETVAWGASDAPYHDVAVPGDYDGDGKTDVAVFRRATGTWYIKRSSDGQLSAKAWGLGTDVPVAADYDGDGKTDIAVWRATSWYIWQSQTRTARVAEWGANYAPYFDQAQPGDYDGDGQADVAVWRASDQTWYVHFSQGGSVMTQAQGQTGDRPIAARP